MGPLTKALRLPESQRNKVITVDRMQGEHRVSVLCEDVWHHGRTIRISGPCQVVNGDILTTAAVTLEGVIK